MDRPLIDGTYLSGIHNGGVYNSLNLNPYIYTYQNPIVLIDPDGNQVFVTHGTTQSTGTGVFSNAALDEFRRIGGNKTINTKFSWNAPLTNGTAMRSQAAQKLVDYVVSNMTGDEPITLVGYSHGGNVDIQAADLIYERTGKKVNLITVSTPAYNSEQSLKDARLSGTESPAEKKSINEHIHIIHNDDIVYKLAQGQKEYEQTPNHKVRNYQVWDMDVKIDGGIDAHTKFPGHKDLPKYLHRIPKIENK